MKHILVLLLLGFALSLCNLSERLHKSGSNSGSSGSSGSSSSSSRSAEKGQPTAAQTAALAGGQDIKWDRQGMSFTVPPKWTELENESKSFVWHSPGSDAATLNVNISPMDESFPTDVSIQAFYDGAKTRAKNGEVDELKWVEIDGLTGVQFREANPEKPDGIRRLQWLAYRKYLGQVQMVNLMLSSEGKDFDRHKDAMYGILYSTKITH
ncbi:MAG TPA: hypothetical protein VGP83_17900 [Pyrinomonadaceae bacterium]|jgi:hypothetical protein|nr:hypothetical protein [Pyrinomonadaceae bacterium]